MGRAKTEKFPMFAGFSLDPKTNKMSAGYIIGISIKPSDFGLTGGEDNATMAAAVVRSLEAQGAAAATARAVAAEQRAEALEREVARLRAVIGYEAAKLPAPAQIVGVLTCRRVAEQVREALLDSLAQPAGEVSDG